MFILEGLGHSHFSDFPHLAALQLCLSQSQGITIIKRTTTCLSKKAEPPSLLQMNIRRSLSLWFVRPRPVGKFGLVYAVFIGVVGVIDNLIL